MGTKKIYYCDACGEETGQLTDFWYGSPSSFGMHTDSIECKTETELCCKCFQAVMRKCESATGKVKAAHAAERTGQ